MGYPRRSTRLLSWYEKVKFHRLRPARLEILIPTNCRAHQRVSLGVFGLGLSEYSLARELYKANASHEIGDVGTWNLQGGSRAT